MTAAAIAQPGRRVVGPDPAVQPAEEVAVAVARRAELLALLAGVLARLSVGLLAGVVAPQVVRRALPAVLGARPVQGEPAELAAAPLNPISSLPGSGGITPGIGLAERSLRPMLNQPAHLKRRPSSSW